MSISPPPGGGAVEGIDDVPGLQAALDAKQPSDADIPTVAASQAEMEAGSEAALRSMSPLRIAQAIAALAGGGGSPFYFDQLPLHSTHGDEFEAQYLNTSLWTPRGRFESEHAGRVADTWLAYQLNGLSLPVSIYQPSPAKETYKIITAQSVHARSGTPVIGPAIVSSSGTGIGLGFRPDENNMVMYNLTTYYYASGGNTLGLHASDDFLLFGMKVWIMLEVVPTALDGDIFFARYSLDGFNWSHSMMYNPSDFTIAQIGWGCHYIPTTAAKMSIDRFNVVEAYDVGNNLVRVPTSGTTTYTSSSQLDSGSWSRNNAADGTAAEWAMANASDDPLFWQVAWSAGQSLNRVVFKERAGDTWGGTAHIEIVDGSGTHRYPVLDDVAGSSRWRVVDFPTHTGVTSMRLEGDVVSGGGANPGLIEIEAYLRS